MLSRNAMQEGQTKKPVPARYLCPITHQIMFDPVFAADGRTYEREAIETWLVSHDTSPVTAEVLESKKLIANFDKRADIAEYLEEHPELYTGNELYVSKPIISDLVIAVRQQQLSLVDRCITKDPRLLTTPLENNYSAWHLACQYGSSEITAFLLRKLTAEQLTLLSQQPPTDFKPIYLNILLEQALAQVDLAQASLLLSLGAELEQPELQTSNSLLQRCIIQGNQAAVIWLLNQQVNLEHSNNEANTPLLLAILHSQAEIAALLLQHGANPKHNNHARQNAVQLAILIAGMERKSIAQKLSAAEQELLGMSRELARTKQELTLVIQESATRISQLENALAAKAAAKQAKIDAAKAEAAARAEAVQKMIKNELPKFLQLVVEGEQDQAEAMLRQQPELALYSGSVTDLSGRTFNNITGFQYAVWALDSHMWNMILNYYLPTESAQEQIEGLETGSWVNNYGKSASWQNLIDALDVFLDLCNKGQWDAATKQWCGAVGKAQQQLPVHVVNQYCHPTRSFSPCPNFAEERHLPRSRKTSHGDWFCCECNGGRLGGEYTFAIWRGPRPEHPAFCNPSPGGSGVRIGPRQAASSDRAACAAYLDHKTQLRSQLLSKYKIQLNKPSASSRPTL